MDEEVLVEEAQRWKDQCLICASGKREFDHELYQCPHEESQEAKRWMMTVRSKIKYTQYSGCFRCGMPQSICNSWKTQRQCPYRGFLIPTVAMMMYGCHAGQMKQAWRQRLREFNVDADDQEAVIEFLGQKVEGQGMEHNRLVEMSNPLDPNPLDVEPVGRGSRTRWTQPVGRQTRPRSALTQTRWMNPSTRWTSNPLDEEVEHAGPKPVGRRTRWMRKSNTLDPTRWTSNPLGVEHAGPNPLDVKPVGRRTRWTSNPSQERINPLEVEHAGPNPRTRWTQPVGRQTRWELNTLDQTRWTSNPLDVEPVGRRTRPRSALTRWKSNTLDPTRWTSNPLDEEVEHAGPNPLDVKPVPGAH
ncbi:predicted protein [Histoplasma mississippiense (nom. inval.)]|uniref:predicted protein n=1 Tax=Ajellomyces capsulatus (strain NAm1 / WU24) TaxID=2059318 RepID=UPI000157D015|nr:predicted protein [Histoplasma mississippiense (nom. inval.)]EDN11020.1 predicted protein [Histoplasma mississippiense (nom. inval.)]